MSAAVHVTSGLSQEPVSGSADLDIVNADAPVRTLLTGEVLFQAGDLKAYLYEIFTGGICVYRARIARPHEVIEFAFPGDVLGLGYLEHQIYSARALVETRVKCLPVSARDDVVKRDHRAKQRHVEALHREFTHRRSVLTTANRENPIGRVAAFFLMVSELNKNDGRDPSIIMDSLKSGVVADWLGLDVESLGRALIELEKRRLIEPSAPLGLRLKDVTGLEKLANENAADLIGRTAVPASVVNDLGNPKPTYRVLQGELRDVLWLAAIVGGVSAISVVLAVILAIALDHWQYLPTITGHI